jgi:hypothetical protein
VGVLWALRGAAVGLTGVSRGAQVAAFERDGIETESKKKFWGCFSAADGQGRNVTSRAAPRHGYVSAARENRGLVAPKSGSDVLIFVLVPKRTAPKESVRKKRVKTAVSC